jgi:hypothetical protein
MRATVGLAKVALARDDASRCLSLLSRMPQKEPAVRQLRGEAHAALGQLEKARSELSEAARMWRRASDGMHEQAALIELERVRKDMEAQHVDAGRLVVFHAAPLVESVATPPSAPAPPLRRQGSGGGGGAAAVDGDAAAVESETTTSNSLHPTAFSKRLGLRAWRGLRTCLSSLRREIKVSLELATVENLLQALQQSNQPILHFLPTREYTEGVTMESYEGELKSLPLHQLRELLARQAPRRPSLVFICARQSVDAGYAFLNAGVPAVVCLRGFLNEAAIGDFVHDFYRHLLTGSTPRAAFEAAEKRSSSGGGTTVPSSSSSSSSSSAAAGSSSGFVFLSPERPGRAMATIETPGEGELRDLSPKLCPSNLPFLRDEETSEARLSHGKDDAYDAGADGHTSEGSFGSFGSFGGSFGDLRKADGSGAVAADDDDGSEQLAHGAAFVGRHLEVHRIVRSCLHNQLTAVYGERGAGKSALILEAARYMRQRNRFPQGIFCCSLEGSRSMKQVRMALGQALNIPVQSGKDLHDLMARYSSCLLILDRCEEAIGKRATAFIWFLTQLLQQSSVKVVISSQKPITLERPEIRCCTIQLAPMRLRDAALLLLECSEREIEPRELGAGDDAHLLDALAHHPLMEVLGGMPSAIRWAARRLSAEEGTGVEALLEELRGLSPNQLAATVLMHTRRTAELAPPLTALQKRRNKSSDRLAVALPSPSPSLSRSLPELPSANAAAIREWPASASAAAIPTPSPPRVGGAGAAALLSSSPAGTGIRTGTGTGTGTGGGSVPGPGVRFPMGGSGGGSGTGSGGGFSSRGVPLSSPAPPSSAAVSFPHHHDPHTQHTYQPHHHHHHHHHHHPYQQQQQLQQQQQQLLLQQQQQQQLQQLRVARQALQALRDGGSPLTAMGAEVGAELRALAATLNDCSPSVLPSAPPRHPQRQRREDRVGGGNRRESRGSGGSGKRLLQEGLDDLTHDDGPWHDHEP